MLMGVPLLSAALFVVKKAGGLKQVPLMPS